MQQQALLKHYKAQTLQTLTNSEIIMRLFEEASRQILMAMIYIRGENSFDAFQCVEKTQRILKALDDSLDSGYPIAFQLREMYQFLSEQFMIANIDSNIPYMKELLSILDDLKNTFKQADRIARQEKIGGIAK